MCVQRFEREREWKRVWVCVCVCVCVCVKERDRQRRRLSESSRAERVPGRDRCESESDSLSLTHALLAGWARFFFKFFLGFIPTLLPRSPLVKLASFKRSINRDVVLSDEIY